MNFLVIINPVSGKKKSTYILKQLVIPTLEQRKIQFKCIFTEYKNHALSIISKYDLSSIDGVIVLGGDGTMHEVINGMIKNKSNDNIPIGLLPAGSGNSLLHDLDNLDVKKTLDCILKYNIKAIDIIRVSTLTEKFYSINLVGWGMVNDINVLAEKLRWLGPVRYNIASVIKIFTYKPRKAKLEIDGELFEDNYSFIIACNTIHIGKGMKMAPQAILDDGKMDLIILKNNFTRLNLLQMFPKLFSGDHVKSDLVEYRKASSFKLFPEVNEFLNIDGEIIGNTPITLDVLSDRVKLLN